MVIDCHGHYTSEPTALLEYRKQQVAALNDPSKAPGPLRISDDEIRGKIGAGATEVSAGTRDGYRDFFAARLRHGPSRRQRSHQRGLSQICNDMIHRVCNLYPRISSGCQLPQSPACLRATVFQRLERCVMNLDSLAESESRSFRRLLEGAAAHRPLVVSALEKMVELDVSGDGQ